MVITKIVAAILDISRQTITMLRSRRNRGKSLGSMRDTVIYHLVWRKNHVTICGGTQPKTEIISFKKYNVV